jgi:hypothetical protein
MSSTVARRKRTALYLSIAGLLLMVAAVTAVSARDPDGVWLRIGIVMMTIGAAFWLPWQALLPAALLIWSGPNAISAQIDERAIIDTNMLLELPGVLGLALFAGLMRLSLRRLEAEDVLLGANRPAAVLDPSATELAPAASAIVTFAPPSPRLDDAIGDLLEHLDGTLALIRTLKAGATEQRPAA